MCSIHTLLCVCGARDHLILCSTLMRVYKELMRGAQKVQHGAFKLSVLVESHMSGKFMYINCFYFNL